MASTDAQAAASLLWATWLAEAEETGTVELEASPAAVRLPPALRPSRSKGLRRADAGTATSTTPLQRTHRVELVSEDPRLLPYLDLLGMALADLVLSNDEMAELHQEAARIGLDESEIAATHAQAFKSLSAALESEGGTANADFLAAIAKRLGVDAEPTTLVDATAESSKPHGICFTGDISIGGVFVPREELERRAVAAGWDVLPSLTKKKCTLLVAGDLASQSGKATKARQWGIDVIDGDQFQAMLASD